MTKVQNQIRKQKYPHQGHYSKQHWEQFKNIIADGLEEVTTSPADALTYLRSLPKDKRSCLEFIKVDILKEIVARQNQWSKEKELELIKVNQPKEQYTQIGSLILSVQTVTMRSNWTPNITTKLYAPPIPTQISNTIGLTGDRLFSVLTNSQLLMWTPPEIVKHSNNSKITSSINHLWLGTLH